MLISLCCGSFCPDWPLLYLVGRWLVLRSSFEKTSPVVPITINVPEISNIYPNPNVCSELQQKFSTLNSTSPPRLTRRLKKSKCPNPKLSLHHTHTHNKTILFPVPCLQKCHYCWPRSSSHDSPFIHFLYPQNKLVFRYLLHIWLLLFIPWSLPVPSPLCPLISVTTTAAKWSVLIHSDVILPLIPNPHYQG